MIFNMHSAHASMAGSHYSQYQAMWHVAWFSLFFLFYCDANFGSDQSIVIPFAFSIGFYWAVCVCAMAFCFANHHFTLNVFRYHLYGVCWGGLNNYIFRGKYHFIDILLLGMSSAPILPLIRLIDTFGIFFESILLCSEISKQLKKKEVKEWKHYNTSL